MATSPRQGAGVGDVRPRTIAGGSTPPGGPEPDPRPAQDARSTAVHMLLAQERERVDVAEQLHEGPIQVLTAAGLRLGTLARAGGDAAALSEELQERLDVAIAQLRRSMRVLRGAELDDGLVAAIRRELTELHGARPHLGTALDIDGFDARPSHATATVCFRVVHATLATLATLEHDDLRRVAISVHGSERIGCSIAIGSALPGELRDALARRLHDWIEAIDRIGGSASVRAGAGTVAVAVELPADL